MFAEYQQVQDDLLPEVTSSGVIVFPSMNHGTQLKLVFEARLDNWRIDFERYIFLLPP